MFFENFIKGRRFDVNKLMYLKKLKKTSNGSISITRLTSVVNYKFKFKKLFFCKKWNSGRNNLGRITVFSKGSRLKKNLPNLNYAFRLSSLFFIANIASFGFKNKLVSLIFNSTGFISYIPTKTSDTLFLLNFLKPLNTIKSIFLKKFLNIRPTSFINEVPFILLQQKKNSNISFIELKPLTGSKYIKSLGSSGKIIKLDTRVGLSLVKLPSGVKKVFSAFSLSQPGSANLNILKKSLKSNKSGEKRLSGFKSIVRGVAMNPVDHPHGGRTKSIKYPRTPWGKTTKFK